MIFRLFAVSYVLLSFLDLFTTFFLIKICGSNIEGNFLAASIYSEYGFKGMAILKILTIAAVMTIAFYVRFRGYRFYSFLIFMAGCTIYSLTVLYTLTLTTSFVMNVP